MSLPTIPDITPEIGISREDSIVLLLSSIAMEEMALAHIVNAEAEKLQYVVGTLTQNDAQDVCFAEVMEANLSVQRMIHAVTIKEVLLLLKLSQVMTLTEGSTLPIGPDKDHRPASKCRVHAKSKNDCDNKSGEGLYPGPDHSFDDELHQSHHPSSPE